MSKKAAENSRRANIAKAKFRPSLLAHALALSLGIAWGGAATAAAAQQGKAHSFAVARQPLAESLNRVAQQAEVQLMVPTALVRGRTAPALSGKYTVDQALNKLLTGTGLVHRSTPNGVITVSRADDAATSTREAQGPDADGTQDPPPAPPPTAQATSNERQLDAVQVTGSRIKRAEVEGPSPVTVISTQQMENEGHTTVFEALDSLVMSGGSVETELSGGFSANAHPLNLRGLGPGRSLLLIDGRRAADYPFPYEGRSNFQNFGNIPSGAVERIEILAGGASAIYGADAVSGVVNIILKKGYEGDEVKALFGTSTMGGRDRMDLQWTGGKTGEKWGLTYALQYYEQDILYGFDRDDWDLRKNPSPDPLVGVLPDNGLRIRVGSTSSTRPLAPIPAGTCEKWQGEFFSTPFRYVNNGAVVTTGNYCGTWNDPRYVHLSKGKKEYAGYLFGTWDFNEDLEGWASLQTWFSKAESLGGFESITGPHTNGVGRLSSYYDPQFNNTIAPSRRLTPLELGGVENMNQHYKERSIDIATGLRGRFGDFDWDFTLSHAEYDFQRERRRMIGDKVNEFFFGPQLGTRPNGVPIYRLNLDRWYRPLTFEEYQSISTIAHYEADSWVNTANFVITGDLAQLPAGPLGAALVVEASSQGYTLDSDPRVLPGVTQLYNLTGTNGGGERDRYAAGLEFSIPLHRTLKATLAGRFDKYDDITDVNDAKTWNAGLEWRPTESLLLRGSYATSFKAPDMHWVFNEGSGSFGSATDVLRCISASANPNCTGYSYTMYTVTAGDPGLTEETGKSWGAGLVWDITSDLSFNVDYWDIRLNGAIDLISRADLLNDEAGCITGKRLDGSAFGFDAGSAYCQAVLGLISRVPEAGEQYGRVNQITSGPINQSYMRVSGIDAGLQYRLATDRFGRYTFRGDWSHTLTSERQVRPGDPINTEWRDDPDNLDFRSKAKASVNWRGGDWSANLSTVRYGSLPKFNSAAGRTDAHYVWNSNIGWRFTDKAELRFYVNNLFNELHPEDETNSSFPYFYESFSPIGREVALQFEYKFK